MRKGDAWVNLVWRGKAMVEEMVIEEIPGRNQEWTSLGLRG